MKAYIFQWNFLNVLLLKLQRKLNNIGYLNFFLTIVKLSMQQTFIFTNIAPVNRFPRSFRKHYYAIRLTKSRVYGNSKSIYRSKEKKKRAQSDDAIFPLASSIE